VKKNYINRRKKNFISVNILIFLIIIFTSLIFFSLYYKRIGVYSLNLIQKFSDQYDYNLSIITISDLKYIKKNKILKYFDDFKDKSIFFVPISKIADDIADINWVKKINIKIDYKNTVIVFLEEEEPIGVYFDKEKKILFSDNLIFLDIFKNIKKYSDLIIFSGNNSMQNSKKLFSNLEDGFKNNVVSASFIENRRWNLILNNSILLKMPEQNIKEAVENYKKIYLNFSNKDLKGIESIDLRISNQAIIKYNNLLND